MKLLMDKARALLKHEAIQQAWLQRSLRERIFLVVLSISSFVFIVHQWLWTPWQENLTFLTQQVQQDKELLKWMQEAHQRYKTLKANTTTTSSRMKVDNLLNAVTDSLKQQQLHAQLTHFEQLGDNKVKLEFSSISFTKLIAWIVKIQQETNITNEQIILNAQNKSGEVKATLILTLVT